MAGFLILPFLLFGAVTLGGKTMIPADNLFQWAPWETAVSQFNAEIPQNGLLTDLLIENLAWKRFAIDSFRAKEIPLWNPHLFAGAPFLATGQHSMLYPFSWLFFILPITKAYGWYTVSQLWLAGALMYVYGRVLRMNRGAAFIAGLIYQGSGFLLTSAAVFPMIIGAAAWLPLLLACIEKVIGDWRLEIGDYTSISKSPIPWIGLGAIALGLQILAGHIEITYYTLLIMALYAGWRLIPSLISNLKSLSSWKPAAQLLSMVILGIMLGGVQIIPFYEVGQVNFREGSASFSEVLDWGFPPRRILTLALPNFFGNPAHHDYVDAFSLEKVPFNENSSGELNPNGAHTSNWGIKNYVEGGIYLGILPLILAMLGLFAGWQHKKGGIRRGQTAFFAFLSFFSIAFIFGTPLYAILYYGLPFINQLHTPFRWVWPLSLCVAVLAGFGAEGGLGIGDWGLMTRRKTSNLQSLISNLLLLSGIGLLLSLSAVWFAFDWVEPFVERLLFGLALASDAFTSPRAFFSYEFWQLLILASLLFLSGLWLRVRQRPNPQPKVEQSPIPNLQIAFAALIIILDLFQANVGFGTAVNPALLNYQPPLIQWLTEQPGHWRLTTFDPHGSNVLNANTPWLAGLQDVRGYDSIIPKQYTNYMAAIEPQNGLAANRVQPIANWESLNSPLLDVLGVKYIITPEIVDLPKLKSVWEGDGVRVYENLAVTPRAYTLPQTSTAVVEDALVGMQDLDPRQYVVVEIGDWGLEMGNQIAPNLQSPISNPYSPATITEYRNIQVVVETAVSTSHSWLILNDSYFPGWKAFVRPSGADEADEIEAPITRVNGNFRGVRLEPGEWTVRFRYSPRSFLLGGLASAMSIIILLFVGALWGWRRIYKPQGKLSTTGSIAKNSALPAALNIFNRLIDFVFAMYYLRVLGPANAGAYATAIATAGFFEILSNYGLDILLIRDVSQAKEKANHYLFNTTLLRLAAAVIGSIPVLLFLGGTQMGRNPISGAEVTAVLFIMAGMLFSGMSKGVTGLFYVNEEAEVPAAMTTATTILKVGLGVIVLLMGMGFVGLAAVSIIVNIITLTALLTIALRRYKLAGPWQIDRPLLRQLVRKGYPLMLIHMLQTVFISVDVILLRSMLPNGDEVVGYYQNAYKWFNALQIVPSFFTLALFPIITREIQRNMDAARKMYRLSLKLMLLLALPIAAFMTFLATVLVGILAGAEFLPHGAIALQIVIWSIPLGWLNSVTNYVLIALGLERMQPRAFAIAVGFNIIANLIFIPRFTYVAAAVTTILSEVVLMAVFAYYLRQRMPNVGLLKMAWKPVLVTAVTVIAMWFGNQIHLVVALIAGLIIYPAGLLLLHVFGEEERRILTDILPASIARRLKLH